MSTQLTMGPVLFNWPPETWRDFYFRIADEAPVGTVYIGEVVCSKRAPFFEPHYADVVERLESAGKEVVFSSLAELMLRRERKAVAELCEDDEYMIEANDASALYHLRGGKHAVGPYVNVYNEDTLAVLAASGARHITLPPELPCESIAAMSEHAPRHDVTLEVMVYGRLPLALSARCYHARAHGRFKDNCQFVCEQDTDGMILNTVDGEDFLVINGIQTLSHACLNLIHELQVLKEMGIARLRLSPHSHDMVETAIIFHDVLHDKQTADDAIARLSECGLDAPFANGFFYRKPGHEWIDKNRTN